MRNIIRSKNFYLILFADACLIVAAYFLAYLLRFEGEIPYQEWMKFKATIPYIVPFKLFIFFILDLYRGMWRYTSLFDLFNILKAVATSSAFIILAIFFIYRFQGFPRSVFIIDAILTFIFIGGIRAIVRIILSDQDKGFHPLRQIFQFRTERRLAKSNKRLLIIGAGNAAEKIVREIQENPRLQYEVVGFLDDDLRKKGRRIHGVSVLGPVGKIHKMAFQDEMDEILIAMPSATATQMRKIIQHCEATGLQCRTTPGIGELIDGKISFKTIREVSFEDLLGRDTVDINTESIGHYLTEKVVLVSGAGGSIGSDLCRQIVSFNPQNLILLDKTENNLFHIEMEFRHRFPKLSITPVLGDVHNRGFLEKFFGTVKPQVVFHAAAFKHVPIVELNPWEGVFNNIIGTKNMVEASHQSGVERFVMISTDKAVRPVSVMGATKRVAEMITSCYASQNKTLTNGTRFVSVRFGNVIGSEGSVIHLFKKQIERFGPVTVTHPEITRYFMTVPEACKLILQAGAMGEGGEIFILDMGTPVKIIDMARDLIRRSGFKPDVDIEIKFIGLRPGEKLYEELITEGEGIVPSSHEKIFVLKGGNNNLSWLNQKIEELVKLALQQDALGIKSKLKEILPEYEPDKETKTDSA
ncbi:MAG: polysaccharide biosynthesis protein [Deltaproteobacteria bacterium]|nr:polysaccharide biosynthesis protein [Deltaproteobacteria bacterium]MBM4324885.1 polysaccharide biosynthesis protein [Deltaproteobacteria bacterium]